MNSVYTKFRTPSTRDTGEFLLVLVKALNARRVLEIGTSNGYSTLWLAFAVKTISGHVTTVELSDFKVALATTNFERSGLSSYITQIHGDATTLLKSNPDSSFDIIFLDSERSEYLRWWPDIKRTLGNGGLLVVDNAISHSFEMATFMSLVADDQDFTTCTVPVGNGEFLATLASK